MQGYKFFCFFFQLFNLFSITLASYIPVDHEGNIGEDGFFRRRSSTISKLSKSSPLEMTQLLADEATDIGLSGVWKVVVDGQNMFEQAFGFSNQEYQVPMTMDKSFPIASNSKLFTAVALYLLQEQGKVDLSRAVNDDLTQEDFAKFGFINQTKWCPVLQDSPNSPCYNITYQQLLSMSSGFKEDRSNVNYFSNLEAPYKGSIGYYVGLAINDPLVYVPGTNYSYSNHNFIIAAYMVEKLSGLKFGEYLQKEIFEPLHLQRTFYDEYDGALGIYRNYADQYYHFFSADTGTELGVGACGLGRGLHSSGALSGTGGITASVDDVISLYLDLFSNRGTTSKILTADSIQQIVKPWTLMETITSPIPVEVFFSQGIRTTYSNTSSNWPAVLDYCGRDGCAGTCISMDTLDTSSSTIAAAFSSNSFYVFDSKGSFDEFKHTVNASLVVQVLDVEYASYISNNLLKYWARSDRRSKKNGKKQQKRNNDGEKKRKNKKKSSATQALTPQGSRRLIKMTKSKTPERVM